MCEGALYYALSISFLMTGLDLPNNGYERSAGYLPT